MKIKSITAYDLLRGVVYIKLKRGREDELNLIKDLIGSIEVLSFEAKDVETSAIIWARLRERLRGE